MTQTIAHKPTHISKTQSNCASCPYFEDFGETNGRGWCNIFDRCARKHHRQSQVCDWEIEYYEKGMAVSELPSCPYEIGQLVKVIDREVADCSQWPIFVVVGRKYSSGRYRSISAYRKESSRSAYFIWRTISVPECLPAIAYKSLNC